MTERANSRAGEQNLLAGRQALVTGASRGIGRACVQTLVDAGAKVVAVARSADALAAVKSYAPDNIESWRMDVQTADFYDRLEAMTQLDILINNAGTNKPQPFAEVDADTLSSMVKLNIEAAFKTAQSAARVMLRAQIKGAIINMSSQMGHVGAPERTVYCMTKHAVEGLTKAMAVELAPRGIRINAVAPTFIETPLTGPMLDDPGFKASVLARIPLGRVGQAQDIARAVLFLASDQARMITGESLKIDGGWTAQ